MSNREYLKEKQKFSVSMADMTADNNEGICLACGFRQGGCEPDARGFECEDCGEKKVYGLEEAALMGAVEIAE